MTPHFKYLCLVLVLVGGPALGGELGLGLPLGRAAYQCNEWIPLTVSGLDGKDTRGEGLRLSLRSEDESALTFEFSAEAASVGGRPRRVEHLRVNGWLLRPGTYTVEVACRSA